MNIVIMDTNFNRLGIIDNADVIWNPKYYDFGEFELYMPATESNLSIIQKEYYVVRDDDDYVGVIQTIEMTASVTEGDYITVKGYFAEFLLNRRVINSQTQINTTLEGGVRQLINDHCISPTDTARTIEEIGFGKECDEITDLRLEKQITGDALGNAIRDICLSQALGFRMPYSNTPMKVLRNIAVGDDLSGKTLYIDIPTNLCSSVVNGTKPVTVNGNKYIVETKTTLAWNNYTATVEVVDGEYTTKLYNYIRTPNSKKILAEYTLPSDFGVVTAINMDACSYKYIKILDREVPRTGFCFEIYKGVDRSYNQEDNPWVVFAEKYDNLTTSTYNYDSTKHTNFAYVAGEGEGAERKIEALDKSNNAVGLQRRELWVDARDLQTNDESVTAERYKEQLLQRGEEKLVAVTENFDGDVELNNMKYKVDFFLGDVCSVITRFGATLNLRIAEVLENWDSNGYSIELTFKNIATETEEDSN